MRSLSRVLIANRGEIAIRVARAAASLGLESVGIYTSVDENALHTRMVTTACLIGPDGTPAARSVDAYLDADGLADLAVRCGCDCVHPGYGFLAESAEFAQACIDRGVTFIGPSPDALRLFGDKVRARALAGSLGIPVAPGSTEATASPKEAAALADQLGYPVMLKAAAGGGGRGMRVVPTRAELDEAFERCRSEAEAAFGDGSLFVEALISRPRHIEVQVLADAAGQAVHLHERDCSVQLRHQKVVEIAPAPMLDDDVRTALHSHALALVRAAGLVNAATVEFLVSPESGAYYFLECNPRVQVEHTVTEEVTGIDIVESQFALADGRSLAELGIGDQAAVPPPRGLAIEGRVVASGAGTITSYKEPSGPGVRVDGCGYRGYAP